MPFVTPTSEQLDAILRQMREHGKEWWDDEADYFDGEDRRYRWDAEQQSFMCHRIDTVVGSYMFDDPISEQTLRAVLSEKSIVSLQQDGFDV